MKNLTRKNYKLDSFERVSEGKFVENNEELKKVISLAQILTIQTMLMFLLAVFYTIEVTIKLN